jgi:hypothetical protein
VHRHGAVTTRVGLGVSDHVCWTYDDVPDLLDAGLVYLAHGYRARLRLMSNHPCVTMDGVAP